MPMQVLLVEDSSGDVRLTQEAFRDTEGAELLRVGFPEFREIRSHSIVPKSGAAEMSNNRRGIAVVS